MTILQTAKAMCKYSMVAVLLTTLSFAQLPQSVYEALSMANIAPHDASFVALQLESNAMPIRHYADTPRVPASTQKLISTAAALDALGKDFVWQTAIYHTGVLVDGVLYGDVVIVGSGDPSMDYQRFEYLMGLLAQKIRHITGDIYIDEKKFVGVSYDPNAFDGQARRAYNAVPNAFLLNFGTLEVRFVPSGYTDETGKFIPNPNADHASVQVFPKLAGFKFDKFVGIANDCKLPKVQLTHASLEVLGAFGVACGPQSIWQNFGNNQLLAKQAVLAMWQAHDLTFEGQVIVGKSPKSHFLPLVNGISKPLSEQIWQINHFSNNVMTEQIALSLPLYAKHRTVSNYEQAFAFLDEWWRKRVGDHPPQMTRASGLCTDCLVRPIAMVNLLQFMYHHHEFEVYKDSLPIAGLSGTMKSLAKRDPTNRAIGRAWIKTGHLNDVNAMAGYIQGTSGKWYAVVGVINHSGAGYNASATAALDAFIAHVATHG